MLEDLLKKFEAILYYKYSKPVFLSPMAPGGNVELLRLSPPLVLLPSRSREEEVVEGTKQFCFHDFVFVLPRSNLSESTQIHISTFFLFL